MSSGYPRRPFDDEGRFVGHDHASLRPGCTAPIVDVSELEVVWRAWCECSLEGRDPTPGPDPSSCATCGERVRAEWSPIIHEQQEENPAMQPTTNGHEPSSSSRKGTSLAGNIGAGLVLVVLALLLVLVASILIFGIVQIWQALG